MLSSRPSHPARFTLDSARPSRSRQFASRYIPYPACPRFVARNGLFVAVLCLVLFKFSHILRSTSPEVLWEVQPEGGLSLGFGDVVRAHVSLLERAAQVCAAFLSHPPAAPRCQAPWKLPPYFWLFLYGIRAGKINV